MNKVKATVAAGTLITSFLIGVLSVSAQTVTPRETSEPTSTVTPTATSTATPSTRVTTTTTPTPTTTVPSGAPRTGHGL